MGWIRQTIETCGAATSGAEPMSEHNTLDVQRRLICAPWATMGIMVQAPPIGKHSCIVECPSIMLTPPPPNPNKSTPWWWLIKGIIKFVQLQLATLNLVDWVGETNPGRTRLRAFLGVLDWLVPPMPERSQHAQLGDVKQFHEDLHPNTAQGLAVDRASLQQHSEEACKSIDLGRMSNENMPNEVMVNILAHLTEPVMPISLLLTCPSNWPQINKPFRLDCILTFNTQEPLIKGFRPQGIRIWARKSIYSSQSRSNWKS